MLVEVLLANVILSKIKIDNFELLVYVHIADVLT